MVKMPLFGKSTKSPSDVVRNLKDALLTLEKGGQDTKKQEKVSQKYNLNIDKMI